MFFLCLCVCVCVSIKQLCSPQNVNCRDLEGRHSTPLHFAAGYNRVSVVEYLLHHGADVHAKDKGYVLECHCVEFVFLILKKKISFFHDRFFPLVKKVIFF